MSKMSGCGKSVALVACSVVCRLLSAGVIYVTPELPEGSDGSGSSWANAMNDVAAACLAASKLDGGGEVWLKKGYHLYNIYAGMPIYSNVKVIGGFAGDETSSADADPKANPTVIGCLTHTNGAKYTPKWFVRTFSATTKLATSSYEVLDRTTWRLNLPPESWYGDYPRTEHYIEASSAGGQYCFRDQTGGVTGAVLKGLTIYGYFGSAIEVGQNSEVEIDSCLIVACGKGVKSSGFVDLHDTDFVGCSNQPISHGNSSTDKRRSVVRCSVQYCLSGDGSILSLGTGLSDVKGCTFRRNWTTGSSGMFGHLPGHGTVEDTLFEDNVVANPANVSGSGMLYTLSRDYVRCVFRGNEMKHVEASKWTSHALIRCNGGKVFRDTVFENNKVGGSRAQSSTAMHTWAPTIALIDDASSLVCINCSFVNNTNDVACSSYDRSGTVVSTVNGLKSGFAFLNCVFSGNRAPADVYMQGTVSAENAPLTAFNTIFHSDVADYLPFSFSSLVSPGLANCCISRWEEVKDSIPTGNNGYLYNITDQDPKLDRSVKTGENGVVALGVGPESPYRKTGRGIWKSSDNRYWFYDDNPDLGHTWRWRNVADKRIQANTGAYMTSSPPPGINADFSSPLAPDAFGAARKLGKVAYGPINAAPLGLVILLR